ncbi:MAG: D-2-hydroxyacid dehydrogenase [Clostridiales bacterium]|nr:D-2-hydroxyacid dehydrogenase [Clostridiales bacterium]
MKKILIQYPGAGHYQEQLEEICKDRWIPQIIPEVISKDDFLSLLPGTEIIIGDPEPTWLKDAPDLRWIQISWAGIGPYVQEKSLHHLRLTNSTGVYGGTISEHVLGMLLSLARRIPAYERNRSKHCWEDTGSEWELEGKTALILGTGDLGNSVAKRLRAFDMEIIGMNRSGNHSDKKAGRFDRMISIHELESYLPIADVIIGCLPGTPDTAGILDSSRLQMMKSDSIFINVGRGTLADTDCLAAMLQEGRMWGAGLDVTEPEPLPQDHPLWDCSNLILTPHVAGVGFGHLASTEKRLWNLALENLSRYKNGQELKNEVNWKRGY